MVAGRRLDLNGEHLRCLDGSRLAGRLQPVPHLNGRERPRLALCRDSRETPLGEEGSVRAGLFPVGHGQQDHEGQSYNPAYTARLVEKTEVQAMHVIVYSRRGEVLTDDVERVAVER